MNVVGKVGSLISQGVYSVATPFHPFGGAVDVIVVEQQDGTYRSTPWYVRFGKFQGVLKGAEKIVQITVNGVDAAFHMYLDNSGEAYFVREVLPNNDDESSLLVRTESLQPIRRNSDVIDRNYQNESGVSNNDNKSSELCVYSSMGQSENGRVDNGEEFFGYHEGQPSRVGSEGYRRCDRLNDVDYAKSENPDSEVVLVSVDGHVLTAPISSCKENGENLQLSTPQFHLGPGDGTEVTIEQMQDSNNGNFDSGEDAWAASLFGEMEASSYQSLPERVYPANDVCNSNSSSDVHKDDGEHTSQSQEPANEDDEDDRNYDLSLKHSSADMNSSLSREDIFSSCLEFSDLTSQHEDDELPVTCSPSMGSPMTGRTSSSLPSAKDTSEHDFSFGNDASAPLSHFKSSSGSGSSAMNVPVEVTESNASFDEETNYAGCDDVSAYNDIEQKDDQISPQQEFQLHENGRLKLANEEECNENPESQAEISNGGVKSEAGMGFDISLCGGLLHAGVGVDAANEVFNAHQLSEEEFRRSGPSIVKNDKLIIRYRTKFMTWEKAAPIVLGMVAFGFEFPAEAKDTITVEQIETPRVSEDSGALASTSSRRWRLWPIPFRRVKSLQHSNSNQSSEDVFIDSESCPSPCLQPSSKHGENGSTQKKYMRTNIPTSEQIATLNLKDGQNMIAFSFCSRVLGKQQVDAHIYLWKWNARIVISDVDGTITKSDVLGQFMPLVGRDWTQSGVARLFSAIKENGYQLLFLSARAIVQAYLTRSFLLNLKQDGKALPNGPVVISPDGLFPSLYREVIRRAPHEFKIACLQDIRALFPPDYNPFYAGFGNRDTDEFSYRQMGIPKGKIFIINPKGEVSISRMDIKSYTSLHTLVNDMFPPTSLAEQEDFNSWNYWKMPLPSIDI